MAHILHLDEWRGLNEAFTAVVESDVKSSIPGDAQRRGAHFYPSTHWCQRKKRQAMHNGGYSPSLFPPLSPILLCFPLLCILLSFPPFLPQESTS